MKETGTRPSVMFTDDIFVIRVDVKKKMRLNFIDPRGEMNRGTGLENT